MQNLDKKIGKLAYEITDISWEISAKARELEELEMQLKEETEKMQRYTIKDIDNFKRELKREGLYNQKLEEFIDQYMIYYNK